MVSDIHTVSHNHKYPAAHSRSFALARACALAHTHTHTQHFPLATISAQRHALVVLLARAYGSHHVADQSCKRPYAP